MEEKVLQNVEKYQKPMWDFIEKIVNIDSGYDALSGIDEVAHNIGEVLENTGFKVDYINKKGPTQILAKRERPGKPKILIMGHMDTVFPQGTAKERPFKIEDNLVYGPGIIDMKSGIGIGVYSVKALIDAGFDDADITFFFVGDEEINHPYSDAAENIARFGKGMDAVFNMEPGRENSEVVTGRKGLWRPTIRVKGIAAHSGNSYYEGASAVLELCKKTVDLMNLSDKNTGTTVSVGTFNGGTLANIIPEDAECRLDVRFETVAEAEKIKDAVREICAHSYDERTSTELVDRGAEDYMPPFEETPEGLKLLKYLQNETNKLGQKPLKGLFVGGSSDASYTTMAGAPTICAMGPRSVGPHTKTEHGWVDSYIERSKLLAMAILHISEFVNNK